MRTEWFKTIVSLSIISVFFFGDAICLCAQESESDAFTLEEITVTAQKREENQQKVAIAMEVISGEDIQTIGKNNLDEILSNISSVLIQSSTDGLRVSIRGISNDNPQSFGVSTYTPSVAVNQDSIYTNRNQSNQNMYDIERVEVLFGPQSTIYATASPGGIVNVVTAEPKIDKYEVAGTLEYGNYNLLHTEGSMNVPVSEKIAMRAAFSTSSHDGYLTNGAMDEDIKSGRLKALFQPSERLSIVLTGEETKTGGQGFASVATFVNQDDKDDPWESASETAGTEQGLSTKKTSAHVDWDMGRIGTLSMIGSYLKADSSSSGTSISGGVTYDETSSSDVWEKGFEMRMASSEDFFFKWIVGLNIYKSSDSAESSSVNPDISTDKTYMYFINKQDMKAVYGNVTSPFTYRIRATVGLRMSDDENTSSITQIPGRSPDEPSWIRSDTQVFDEPIYKVGFEYDLSDNSMLYADLSSSYRMNGATIDTPPEELIAYTAGAKNRLFGNKLQINASAYYYDYTNYFANLSPLRPAYDSDGDGILDTTYEEDGKKSGDARVWGVDVQTSTIITPKDRLDISVSYLKKYFTDLFVDWSDVVNELGIPDLDYSNKDMPQAPRWNVAASYNHTFLLGNGGSLKAGLDVRYTTKTKIYYQSEVLNLEYDQDEEGNYTGGYTTTVTDTGDLIWQEAYHMVDANIIYTDPSDKWTISAYVDNVENYCVKRFMDGQGNLMVGDPRTYGAVFTVKY